MSALDVATRTAIASTEGPTAMCLGRPGILRSSKILDLHLDRVAIVYVRQSDSQQVLNRRESRERQYNPQYSSRLTAYCDPRLQLERIQGLILGVP
jgi:hypothetical protein